MAELQINGIYLEGFSEDIPLSASIYKIGDIAGRSGFNSKTVRVARSKHNERTLGFPFFVGASTSFNDKVFTDAVVYSNGLPILEGKASLLGSDQTYIYLLLLSNNSEWIDTLRHKNISDLNFADIIFSNANFQSTWTALRAAKDAPTIDSVKFTGCLIERSNEGTLPNTTDLTLNYFRPDIFVRPVLFKIFQEAGYNVVSDYFTTGKGLDMLIPFTNEKNFNTPKSYNEANKTLTEYQTSVNQSGVMSGNWLLLPVTNVIDNGIFRYRAGNADYIADGAGKYRIKVKGTIPYGASGGVIFFNVRLVKDYAGTSEVIWTKGVISPVSATPKILNLDVITDISTGINEVFRLEWRASTGGGTGSITLNPDLEFSVLPIEIKVSQGLPFNIADILPNKSQSEFVKSIANIAGLVIDTKDNVVRIEPFKDYYKANDIEDWTDKLNTDLSYRVSKMSKKYPQVINFKYQPDSNDELLTRNNLIFSDPYNNSLNTGDLATSKGSTDISVIFSPTVMGYSFQGSIYCPVIRKDNITADNNFNIRLLYFGGFKTGSYKAFGTTYDSYPFMYSILEFSNGQEQLYFKNQSAVDPLNYVNDRGLVTQYYSEIIDFISNGYELEGWFTLSELDFMNLDFRKSKIVNGSNWYLSSVSDYVAGKPVKIILNGRG